MKDWNRILVSPDMTIRDAIRVLDQVGLQLVMVASEEKLLLGTATDGDIRRGILDGISLEDRVSCIMNSNPITILAGRERGEAMSLMKNLNIKHVPVVDDNGCLVGLESIEGFFSPSLKDNLVVLMAGGLGTRLRPLTDECPKPLLKIGGKPILETILLNFIQFGFYRFVISVNYKADMIKSYFGDGKRWNVSIDYLEEEDRMGTAGALGLLNHDLMGQPFIVMNGDVLTTVNLSHLLDFHQTHKSVATVCTREYEFQVPYGVLRIDQHRVERIEEKPVERYLVNAGIYVLDPSTLTMIPKGSYYDMPVLFDRLIAEKCLVAAFPIREYWLDVGQPHDFVRAQDEYHNLFN